MHHMFDASGGLTSSEQHNRNLYVAYLPLRLCLVTPLYFDDLAGLAPALADLSDAVGRPTRSVAAA